MGSKGSQATNTVQNTAQTYNANPAISGIGNQAISQAQAAGSQPFQMPVAPVAGFSQDQQTAFGNINNAQGMAQPYFNQAANYLSPEGAQSFLNPYAANVMAGMKDVFGQQRSGLEGNLVQSAGGVGADRIGVGQANLAHQQDLAAGQTLAGLYSDSARQAQAAGQGMGNLGMLSQNAALSGAQAQLQSGGLQQQLAQQQLNAPYQNQLARLAYPYQNAQFLAGITGGLAPALGGTTIGNQNGQTTAPQPSMLSQILGVGTAGAGLYGAFGGFNGSGSGKGGTQSGASYGGYGSGSNGWGSMGGVQYPAFAEGGEVGEEDNPHVPGLTSNEGLAPIPYLPLHGGAGHSSPLTGGVTFQQPQQQKPADSGGGLGDVLKTAASVVPFFLKDGGTAGYDSGGGLVAAYPYSREDYERLGPLWYPRTPSAEARQSATPQDLATASQIRYDRQGFQPGQEPSAFVGNEGQGPIPTTAYAKGGVAGYADGQEVTGGDDSHFAPGQILRDAYEANYGPRAWNAITGAFSSPAAATPTANPGFADRFTGSGAAPAAPTIADAGNNRQIGTDKLIQGMTTPYRLNAPGVRPSGNPNNMPKGTSAGDDETEPTVSIPANRESSPREIMRQMMPTANQPYPDALERNPGAVATRSPWMALVNAGATMAATPGPLGVSLGKGMLAGTKSLDDQRKELQSEQGINQKAQALYQTAKAELDKYNKMTPGESGRLMLQNKELNQSNATGTNTKINQVAYRIAAGNVTRKLASDMTYNTLRTPEEKQAYQNKMLRAEYDQALAMMSGQLGTAPAAGTPQSSAPAQTVIQNGHSYTLQPDGSYK